MRKKTRRGSIRYVVESLENRRLLAGTNGIHIDVGSTPSPFNLFSNVVTSGTQITVSGDAFASSPDVKATTTPAGSLVFQWYGGSVIGSFPLRQDNTNHIAILDSSPLTLDAKDAGPAITGGTYQGDYILGYSFTGDDNFAQSHAIDANDFANVSSPNFNGVISGFIVKLDVVKVKNKLAFLHAPDDAAVSGVLNPPVTIQILDNNGVPVVNATDPVTLTLTGGDPTATLSGTTTVNAVGGVATFSDLSIGKPGNNYQLTAASGTMDSIFSAPFKISAGQFKFIKSPKGGDANAPIVPPIVVALVDGDGRTITSDSSTVVTLTPVGFNGDAPVTGNEATLVNGIATFDQVVLKKAGFYQLQASDGVHAVATTGKFKIGGDKIVIRSQPGEVNVNDNFPLTVAIVNSKGKLDTNATTTAQLSLNPLTAGTTAQLGGIITVSFVGGLAVFNASDGPTIDTPGKYTLTVTEVQLEVSSGLLIPTNTTTPVTSKVISVGNYHLVFATPAKDGDVGQSLNFAVAEQDSKRKTNTKLNSNHVQLTLTPIKDGVNGQLSTYTPTGFVAGVQVFSDVNAPSIAVPGTYTLTATEVDDSNTPVSTTTAVTSKPFKVLGFHLAFLAQPTIESVFRPIPVKIAVLNSKNKIDTTQNSLFVHFAIAAPQPTDAKIVDGDDQFSNGVIEYGSLYTDQHTVDIDKPGTFQITAKAYKQDGSEDPTVTPATSRIFKLVNSHIAFLQQPAPATYEGAIPFKIAIVNAHGTVLTDDSVMPEHVALTLQSANGADAAGLVYSEKQFVGGEITFPDYFVDSFGYGAGAVSIEDVGEFKLTASVLRSDGSADQYIDAGTSHPFKVLPRALDFTQQPGTIAKGFPIPTFEVGVHDAKGVQLHDSIAFAPITLDIQIAYRPANGSKKTPTTILGDMSMTDGLADFSLFRIDQPGEYVIVATDITGGGAVAALLATSAPFKIVG